MATGKLKYIDLLDRGHQIKVGIERAVTRATVAERGTDEWRAACVSRHTWDAAERTHETARIAFFLHNRAEERAEDLKNSAIFFGCCAVVGALVLAHRLLGGA